MIRYQQSHFLCICFVQFAKCLYFYFSRKWINEIFRCTNATWLLFAVPKQKWSFWFFCITFNFVRKWKWFRGKETTLLFVSFRFVKIEWKTESISIPFFAIVHGSFEYRLLLHGWKKSVKDRDRKNVWCVEIESLWATLSHETRLLKNCYSERIASIWVWKF